MKIIKLSILAFLCTFLILGCKKDRKANWDAAYLIPLASSRIEFNNVFGNYISGGANNADYIYETKLYENSPGLLSIPDTGLNTSFTLARLKLADRSIERKISLGEINPLFLLLDGTTTSIPAQNQTNLTPFDIDASDFFDQATIKTGEMVLEFENELPVNLSLLEFDLINKANGDIIGSATFNNVAPNTKAIKIIDLANKQIGAALQVKIKTLQTDASSGNVLIDANKGLNIKISVRNLTTSAATAVFPSQTVLEQDEPLSQYFDGAELKYIKVRSGKLKISLYTSIAENMTLYLKIPSATKNGVMIDEEIKVEGARNGRPTSLSKEIDMAGYVIDYRGKDPDITDTVNTFYQIMRVVLDSSGRKLSVSLNDSINLSYGLEKLVPEYAIGYLGNTINETGDDNVPMAIFEKLNGNINFNNVSMDLNITNGIGTEGSVLARKIIASNSKKGIDIPLTAAVINNPYIIGRANFNPFFNNVQQVTLQNSNSNVKQFVENLPDKIKFNMQIATSPNGNNNNWQDFIYYNSKFQIDLRLKFQNLLSFNQLQFKDSINFNLNEIENLERVKEGKIYLFFENRFAFSINLKLAVYDKNNRFLDTIGNNDMNEIIAASGAVAAKGKAFINIPPNKWNSIKNAAFAYIILTANTPPNTQISINSSDYCKIDVSADVTYQIKAN